MLVDGYNPSYEGMCKFVKLPLNLKSCPWIAQGRVTVDGQFLKNSIIGG